MLRLLINIALIVPLGCQLQNSGFFKDVVLVPPRIKITCEDDNARKCADELEHCDQHIDLDKRPDQTRKMYCEDPKNENILWRCLLTCGMCCIDPRYACEDKKDSQYNCTEFHQLGLCDSTGEPLHNIAIHDCALTCAMCNATVPAYCKDNQTVYTCRYYKEKSMCDKYENHEDMVHECPVTCGLCDYVAPPGGTSAPTTSTGGTSAPTTSTGGTSAPTTLVCMDHATDCAANIILCNNPEWHETMVNRCPATCGFCGPATTGPTACVDKDSSTCIAWAQQGFCTSSHYTDAQRKQYCPKTCNLC